ncbi:hypothetical protein [Acinetobacter sp. LA-1]|uniref:hypothetical protein n=1 Tax=Acinetobacter sp. LA-1 TaxID=3438431 RepID=UPI003F3ADF0D
MAYVCESYDLVTNVCQQWAVYSPFLPELTDEARDALILYVLKIFAGVFIIRRVIQLIQKARP